MRSEHVLLGFDAREAGGGGEWNERRRSDYLFRVDVARPLSIDQRVWRPVVEVQDSPHRFWGDLARLREVVRERPERPWIVALGVSLSACSPEEAAAVEPFIPRARSGEPTPVDPRWTFLGYDIADPGGCISGLMNCGFLPAHEDVERLRALWAPKLNSNHLFDELADAVAFKNLSNHRVPEHAPFFVNGLWLIEMNTQEPDIARELERRDDP
jgi:hypothetical protein